MKKMLVITPDLSLNGANVVLLELLELLKENMRIHVIASEEGQFGDRLAKLGISYEVKPVVNSGFMKEDSYDLVFLNTSSVHYYAMFFQNREIPVHWWFHESYEQLSGQKENFAHLALLSDNFRFYGVTPRVIRGLQDLYGVNVQLLPMAVKDVSKEIANDKAVEKPIVFFPGAYTYIKGQDIMLAAIDMLPKQLAGQFQFVFAGYKLPAQEEYYQKIKQMAEAIPEVVMIDQISREEVYQYYRNCICVVAPSRVDSTPTTIVEAMMHEKLCIVSSGAGMSELMTDCQNGFVFPNENVEELFKRLLLVLSDYRNLSAIAQNGRKLYEDYFLPERVIEIMQHFLAVKNQ